MSVGLLADPLVHFGPDFLDRLEWSSAVALTEERMNNVFGRAGLREPDHLRQLGRVVVDVRKLLNLRGLDDAQSLSAGRRVTPSKIAPLLSVGRRVFPRQS
jgi:hypothetical protein